MIHYQKYFLFHLVAFALATIHPATFFELSYDYNVITLVETETNIVLNLIKKNGLDIAWLVNKVIRLFVYGVFKLLRL
jgi:hypothetical protein